MAHGFRTRALIGVLATAACLLFSLPSCQSLSTADVSRMQTLIEGFINRTSVANAQGGINYPMIGTLTRLAFHDCSSPNGCDGCVNLNLADNFGLAPAVNGLEALYSDPANGLRPLISRADFWALASLVAVNFGARLQTPPPPPPPKPGMPPPPPPTVFIPSTLVPLISFKTGRTDCATSPVGDETAASFPSGLKGEAETFGFFRDSYNFSPAEVVAIMGAHTLGRARPENSGFRGPWVPRNDVLDNGYYKDLSNGAAGWSQVPIVFPPPPNPASVTRMQWERTTSTGARFMMLNSDMCLFKSIVPDAVTGAVSCTYATCPAAAHAPVVARYAQDNTAWLTDFGVAFTKMSSVCGRAGPAVIIPCNLVPLTP